MSIGIKTVLRRIFRDMVEVCELWFCLFLFPDRLLNVLSK